MKNDGKFVFDQKCHFFERFVIPEYKSQPARVRVYKYPDFGANSCLASKSFFKAEDARLYWSASAASVVVLASTQIDKSGQSYYGDTQLHHLCARGRNSGEAALVPLDKAGPVYRRARKITNFQNYRHLINFSTFSL